MAWELSTWVNKVLGQTIGSAIVNDIVASIKALAGNGDNNASLPVQDIFLESRNFKRLKTFNTKFGFWGDVHWASTTTIVIRPKRINGMSWIGCILNDGTYLESTTTITVTLNTSTLDGVGAIQNSSWYRLFGYKNSSGNLAFGLWWMPVGTLSAGSPTTVLSLNQINSKDIKSLFPVGSELCLFETETKFETPIFYQNGTFSAANYSASKSNMPVASYPAANQITLTSTLSVTNFTVTTTKVYAVNGYAPFDCSTGNIHTNIGSNPWIDSGIAVMTTASGTLKSFTLTDNKFYFSNGAETVDYTTTTGVDYSSGNISSGVYTTYYEQYIPHDKLGIQHFRITGGHIRCKNYYFTYGDSIGVECGSVVSNIIESHTNMTHKLSCLYGAGTADKFTMGYII